MAKQPQQPALQNDGELRFLPGPLLRWYDAGHRSLPWREHPLPYYVWISEIMLQQTRVEAVRGYFSRFIAALPNPAALAGADEELLLKLWEGLGYYNRARNLQKAARIVTRQYGGVLPADFETLLTLPGIGRYTAGAISSIAYGRPAAAVDGNVLRVVTRILACDADISRASFKLEVEQALLQILPAKRPGDFNQALMELGATVCLPGGAPLCERCPLQHLCRAHHMGCELQFPQKPEKKPRPVQQRTVFLLLNQGRIALRRREPRGLLAGLWELPGFEGRLDAAETRALLERLGCRPLSLEAMPEARHIFTHLEWRMSGWMVRIEAVSPPEEWVWVRFEELETRYALPSALRVYYEQLRLLFGGLPEEESLSCRSKPL